MASREVYGGCCRGGRARLVPLPVGCLSWLLHPVSVTATTMKAADRPMIRLT
ncbi:hypothetical protein [Streptomyces olivochromogenes]|uniref:hypothetical protein n=1 Tax=Streptomyces olivochromogenes TaxID=1963 RepID=UPI0036BC4772